MSTRPLFFIPLLLLLAASPPRAAVELEKPTVRGNISIQLPKNWKVGESPGAILAASPAQPDKDSTGVFPASLLITQTAGPLNIANQQQEIKKQYPTYRALEQPAGRVINGMQVWVFGGSFTPKNSTTQLRIRFYMFSVNDQVYTLTFLSLASLWATYDATVDASVGTFNVKKPPPSAPHAVH